MEINGHILGFTNGIIQFKPKKLTDELIRFIKENIGNEVEMNVDDGRTITVDQRKKAFAMMNDISDYTGYSLLEVEERMKVRFICTRRHPKWFSLSNCGINMAKVFIDFLIAYCLKEEIPFTTIVFDEIQQSYPLRVRLLKHRLCYVCGKPNADIDHVDTIGSGRNRRHTNQVGYYAWSVCRTHHTERHKIGVKSFARKYQIKPVKLTRELIEELNLSDKGAVENE
ncbi:putative HNHc nuclease (plasmid) [Apilactobacillus apisilvae]|uniref:HNHc nuclease n=1 Tax=Apilactobacillus apisilvae TaxID=2923364 RepID=A0ABY4PJN9_9LACO|nr:putative HNHc nuclease [Apilactobacillus apisilvae]UQS85823.1 putative HNHc nuclease [Apilactobacillus apisilvae]